MNGIYEHRRFFRRHYEPVFEVSDEGILYHQHLYVWGDIKDIQRRSSSGSAGFGFILFTNGVKCMVNLRTFRKMGDELHLSFWGDNQAFDQLHQYYFRKKMESFKDPREDELLRQLDKLEEELEVADDEKDSKRLANHTLPNHLFFC